jgi:hypothetical protein
MIAGVFPNTAAASCALARTVASRSLPPPPVKGIGDRAFLSGSNLLLQVNNVLFVLASLRWVAGEQEMGMIAHEVANELDAGTTFVTRGEVVEVPEVVALDLPERVSLGAEVSGRALRAETQTDYDVAVAEGARKSVPEVERLATSMPAETEEIRRLNDLLWSGQLQPAIEAIHYFAGLRAGPLLALALEHPADYVRGEAASALERLGNRAFVPQLLACLRRSNVTVRGGTEAQIAHSRLVCALLSALGRLTGQDFGPVDAEDFNQVNAVIAKCESWLATHPLSSLPGEVPLAAQPPAAGDVESLFEAKYAAWAAWLQEHASPSSKIDLSTLFDNQPFRDIVALGPPAVPYMVDKMEQNHWIGEALSRITKFKWHERRVGPGPGQWVWIIEEFPELAEETRWPWRGLWRKWWNEGSQKTPQWFDQRYREWQEVLAQGKGLEAQEKYQRIIDLGIGALPYMVEKIQAGDTALVGAVSTLTQGAVGATATPAQCIEWWNANKANWTLPWGENGAQSSPAPAGLRGVAAAEAAWLDQRPTSVDQIRPALEEPAAQLARSPSLQTQLDGYLRETVPGFDPNVPTPTKLELLYAQLIDQRTGVRQAGAIDAVDFFAQLSCPALVMAGLKHPSIDVQIRAVRALGPLGYRPAVGPLVDLLRRYNFRDFGLEEYTIRVTLREALLASLGEIIGMDFSGVRFCDLGAVDQVVAKCESWLATPVPEASARQSGDPQPTTAEQALERLLGPLPSRGGLISTVNVDGLPRRLIPAEQLRFVGVIPAPWGTWHCFERVQPAGGAVGRRAFGVSAEVHVDARAASADLADRVMRRAAIMPAPVPGVGDRAFVAPGGFWLQVNNVVLHVLASWEPGEAEMVRMAKEAARELEASAALVSADGHVPLPYVVDAEPPADGEPCAGLSGTEAPESHSPWVFARPAATDLGLAVAWRDSPPGAFFSRGGHFLLVEPGRPLATLDGKPLALEAPAYLQNDRLVLPLSALLRAFGLEPPPEVAAWIRQSSGAQEGSSLMQ